MLQRSPSLRFRSTPRRIFGRNNELEVLCNGSKQYYLNNTVETRNKSDCSARGKVYPWRIQDFGNGMRGCQSSGRGHEEWGLETGGRGDGR